MPVLTIGIVGDCFYLLIFYSEKFSTSVRRLPFAVQDNETAAMLVYQDNPEWELNSFPYVPIN